MFNTHHLTLTFQSKYLGLDLEQPNSTQQHRKKSKATNKAQVWIMYKHKIKQKSVGILSATGNMHDGLETFLHFPQVLQYKKMACGCIQRSVVFHFLLFSLCHVNRINATWPNKTNTLIGLEVHLSTHKANCLKSQMSHRTQSWAYSKPTAFLLTASATWERFTTNEPDRGEGVWRTVEIGLTKK